MTHTAAGNLMPRLMAALCLGLFAGAMAFDLLEPARAFASDLHRSIWYGFQFGLPVLVGGVCLSGKRWAAMIGVIYGTIGLALDIATFVQSLTAGTDSLHVVGLILLTALLNFLLIVIGGRQVLSI
ncbi:MAG: hypothetical protein OXB94_04655 [Nitrospira sp.]|nr:hypothetical protein [Nitrospira sp.]